MRKLRLSLFILGICLSIPGFARINIVLKGSWNRVEKSISSDIPFQIWLEEDKSITVQFFENIGPVNISVITHGGSIIYSTTIDATKMSSYPIILDDDLKRSEYEIVVSNESNLVKGLFAINDIE